MLTDCLHRIPAIPDAIAAFEARRRPRTDWVRAQTHRRDHTRYLPPAIRDNVLRFLGRRILHSNYVALAPNGDAAHATSPNMAQGAAMALEDALVLTDCLRDVPAIPAALAAFEARRRSRIDWVRAQTHRRDRTRYLPPIVRNNVLRLVGRRIFHATYSPLLDAP